MLRPITLIPGILASGLLAAALLAEWTGLAQAEPRMVYTRHTRTVNLRDLDLSHDSGQRALQARIADAANEVCGGRPDRGNRYTQEELKRMLPAYDKCRAEAVQRMQASWNVPVVLAQSAAP
jgi:UrcA family protein